MDENYSDPGDSDGGSTPVQDEHEDFEDDGLQEEEEHVAVSPVASPKEDEGNEREEEGEIADDDDEIEPEEHPESEGRDWKGEVASDGEVGEAVSDVESEREHEEVGEVQSEDEERPVEEDGGNVEDQDNEYDPISPKEEDQEEGEFDSSKEEEDLVEGHVESREDNEGEEYARNMSDGEVDERLEEAEEKEEDGGLGEVDEVSADEDEGQEDGGQQTAHDMEEETDFVTNASTEQQEEEEEEEGEVEMMQKDTPVSPASNIDSPEEFDDQKETDIERHSGPEDDAGEAETMEKDEDAEDGITHQRQESDHEDGEEDDRKGALGDTEMYEGAEQVSEDEDQQEDAEPEDGKEKTQSDGENQEAVSDEEAVASAKEDGKPMSPVHGLDAVSDNEDEDDGGLAAKPSKEAESGEESDEEKELIADIFGSSDEEGEEFEGFGEKDLEPASKKRKSAILSSDDDDDVAEPAGGGEDEEEEGEEQGSTLADILPPETKKDEGSDSDEGVEPSKGYQRADFVSDFDLMMERKKAEMGKRRKRRDVDIINDNDDIIMAMITQMKEAAEADQELNKERKAAVKKLLMYPRVMQQLQKADLQQTLLECGILSAMKEWLMPLPDKSLPHLKIRTQFLKILKSFPPISQDLLKSSGVGKAVMILYRHPKELRTNKDLAGRIINNWSRPIFGVDDSFLAMSKEERQHRDLAQLSAVKRRRMSSQDGDRPKTIERALQQGEKALRPGDKGWIGRARVPMPSNKDYLVRPKSMVEAEFSARSFRKPPPSKLDKQLKKMKAYKAKSKSGNLRAINVNIAGAKMSL